MKTTFITIATVLLLGAAYLTYSTSQESPFGAGTFAYFSNEAKILRYLGKMETNKGNPVWDNAHAVKNFTKEDGSIDYDKARQKFIDQNLMSGAEFDSTVAALRGAGYIHPTLFKATGLGVSTAVQIQNDRNKELSDIAALEEQKRLDDINNLTTTPAVVP